MAYAFNPNAEGAPEIGELFAENFPHFDGLIVPFEAGQEVVGEGDPTESYYLVMRGHVPRGEVHPRRPAAGVRLLYARRRLRARAGRGPQADDRGGRHGGDGRFFPATSAGSG